MPPRNLAPSTNTRNDIELHPPTYSEVERLIAPANPLEKLLFNTLVDDMRNDSVSVSDTAWFALTCCAPVEEVEALLLSWRACGILGLAHSRYHEAWGLAFPGVYIKEVRRQEAWDEERAAKRAAAKARKAVRS